MIRGVKIAGIPVRDQDAALKFYTEKLGFKVATDQPMGAGQRWIELLIPGADTRLALFTPPGHEDRIGTFQSLTFWCDDVFATAKTLAAKASSSRRSPKRKFGEPLQCSKMPTAINSSYPAGKGQPEKLRAD
jgi:catechol 2,3-dioxygenase-like lactoylglutathione lyase family enzyme